MAGLPGSMNSRQVQAGDARLDGLWPVGSLPADMKKTTIFYGSDERQKVHLYHRPNPFIDQSVYLAIMIPGGGWKNHRDDWREDSNRTELLLFLENHFQVAYIDYRPVMEGQRWPTQKLDWLSAFEMLRTRLKPAGIVGWGHSAGAHGILTLATDPSAGHFLRAIAAAAAPTDLSMLPRFWNELFGDSDPPVNQVIAASPFFKVSEKMADTLLVHGDQDQMVPFSQSENLHYAILQKGGNSDFMLLENAGHTLQPADPDLSVTLSADEVAKATASYLMEKVLIQHPRVVRRMLSRYRPALHHRENHSSDRDESKRMQREVLIIRDCESEDSLYYRLYYKLDEQWKFFAEIPKTGRITHYVIDMDRIMADRHFGSGIPEFLVTRVLPGGKESRTSRTFSDFRQYCD